MKERTMYSKREVIITDGCPCRKAWGQPAIVLDEYYVNKEKHLYVDLGGAVLLVKEVFTRDYDGLSEGRA